jgi:hypothetical protein
VCACVLCVCLRVRLRVFLFMRVVCMRAFVPVSTYLCVHACVCACLHMRVGTACGDSE